jgi:hypothetical protein
MTMLALVALVMSADVEAKPDAHPRLLVNTLTPQGVSEQEAGAMADAIIAALSNRGLFEVVSSRDVQTILGVERQRALLGACQDDNGCSGTADLQSAMSIRYLLTGQLAKVGSAYQLTLQLLDLTTSKALSRSTRLASSLEALRSVIPWVAAEATGSPLPPPPTRIWQVSMMVAGGAAVLAGGALGVLALSRQSQLNDELCPGGVTSDGRCNGTALRPRSFYAQQNAALTIEKIVSISVMAAGAVLAGLGFWLLPPDDPRTRLGVLLVPSANGLSLAGTF